MPSRENKTKDLFRQLSCQGNNKESFLVEEDTSVNRTITQLLANASKKGGEARGQPDFIVTRKNVDDFVIVVECKSKTSKHESPKQVRETTMGYAVNGVKHYGSFLAKKFNVILIALSGESEKQMRVSYFLQVKGEKEAHPIFEGQNKLLELNDIYEEYLKNEKVEKHNLDKIKRFSRELNDTLHNIDVLESYRCVFLAACLLALRDRDFSAWLADISSYPDKSILKELVKTIEGILDKKEKSEEISRFLVDSVAEQQKLEQNDVILPILNKINENLVYPYANYELMDALSICYTEFLKYANKDKALGVVLTPIHIAKLFCEIAKINKNSRVLDVCLGTGGFMVQALRKMIKDAAGDSGVVKQIQSKQIIGVELQRPIYTIACANMLIHNDGKSNIFRGNCMEDDEKTDKIINLKPNVALLNPPYAIATKEMAFVLRALELLDKGSLCVAIIPSSCVATKDGKGKPGGHELLELKRKLMEEHKLEAVFSMNDDLFKSSEISVGTSIIVVKAKERHSGKTYLADWREDEHYWDRTIGRVDNGNWGKTREEWLKRFEEKKEVKGHSVLVELKPEDEWSYFGWIKPDYDDIDESYFEKELKDHVTSMFKLGIMEEISAAPISNAKVNIDTSDWKEFKCEDLFNIYTGGDKKPSINDGSGRKVFYVESATNSTHPNGLKGKVEYDGKKIYKNFITVTAAGQAGTAYYQSEHVAIFGRAKALLSKENKLNPLSGIFISVMHNRSAQGRFSRSRSMNADRQRELSIFLPAIKKSGGGGVCTRL